MTHLEAIILAADPGYSSLSEFGQLWSNGHIAVKSDTQGKDQPKLPSVWAAIDSRSGEIALSPGVLCREENWFYRSLEGDGLHVAINEAFYRALSGDGITASTTVAKSGNDCSIAFRRGSELLAVVMPIRQRIIPERTIEATDAEVFASFACEANGFYLQSIADIKKKLLDELKEIYRDLHRAKWQLDEAQEELDDLTASRKVIEDKIAALKAAV